MAADSTTASAQRRRVTKPLMEKRRRARINTCLAQLKDIVMKSKGGENFETQGRASRLEKADILEMTVQYVKRIKDDEKSGDPAQSDSFQDGYQRCLTEVADFLTSSEMKHTLTVNRKTYHNLIDHLSNVLTSYRRSSGANDSSSAQETERIPSPQTTNSNSTNDSNSAFTSRRNLVSPSFARWNCVVSSEPCRKDSSVSNGCCFLSPVVRPTVLVEPSSSRTSTNNRNDYKPLNWFEESRQIPMNPVSESMWRPW